ncbi:caspase-1 isoform X1 [Ixodes scapularis]|uniref:caspase-1 isoform X1 n=1 Tax=Ixodes scapularis TaxID=6945 RepID=UPI001A9E6CCD|nr:caspase-1 isoform X1 [Ixodes scapularis]
MADQNDDPFGQNNDRNANSNSQADAKGLFGGGCCSFSLFPKKSDSAFQALPTSLESEEYNMEHTRRGKCVIFNNRTFDFHTKLSERRGTDLDAENLYLRFSALGFDTVIHQDFKVKQMLFELDRLGNEDHSRSDCFVCCILSHGDKDVIFGTDGKFPVDSVLEPFRGDKCPSLVGKPKLFFIQACRGDRLDDGVPVVVDTADAPTQVFRIPTHADFLTCFSTVPGFYSWRNTTQGSWFVQSLCKVLQQRARNTDLLSMMTVVCRQVVLYYESSVPGDTVMDRKKQVPSIVSTLTRLVYFRQKS